MSIGKPSTLPAPSALNLPAVYGNVTIRLATEADAHALAPRLRPEDVREITAHGVAPLDALLLGISTSKPAYAITLDGVGTVSLFGINPVSPAFGAVWLLASPELFTTARRTFLRHSRRWLTEFFRGHHALGNFVDARNKAHIAWLRWLGFRFIREIPFGINGEPFIEFLKLRDE